MARFVFLDLADCGLRIRRSEISNKKPVKSGMRGDDSQVIEKAAKINGIIHFTDPV
jgi:hypothetical protein